MGILTAALLHDIGKTLTGLTVELFEHAEDAQGSPWLPDAGNMAQNGGRWYRVSFPEHKAPYALHAELAWTFFAAIVPASVRRWLASGDPSLLPALRQYLSGQHEGSPFADIIRKADMASTARDLKSGSRQRFATARRTPLIETVMETLVEMLAERGRWFSVASSAGGDLFRQGGTVYMVSKHVPDRIREFLKQTKHPAAPFFPSDNQRVFDTLLEYGAVLPNPADERRAVTAVDIAFTRSDGETRAQRFTMLAFKLETLYPDGNYPAEFAGSLNVSSDQSPAQHQGSSDTEKQETGAENTLQSAESVIPADIPPPPRKRWDTETENHIGNETEAASELQTRFMATAVDLSEYRETPRQPENIQRPSEKPPAGQPENASSMEAVKLSQFLKRKKLNNALSDAVAGILGNERSYFEKLVSSLYPLLEKLTSGKVVELISPDFENLDDTRPIMDWRKVMEQNAVVYVGLDALTDAEVAAAVGNAMFADLTSLVGQIYKHGHGYGQSGTTGKRKVAIHADEFNELIGNEFIPMLNKAGGAGYQVTAYTQTWSDVEAKIGSKAKAEQMGGNFNTMIMLRVKLESTAQMLTSQLPDVRVVTGTLVSGAGDIASPEGYEDFTSSNEDRLSSETVPTLMPADLTSLPKGQAFALLEGGNLYKLRLPLPLPDPDSDAPDDLVKMAERMRETVRLSRKPENDEEELFVEGRRYG